MLSALIFLVIIGVCLYLVESYIPMSPPIQTVLRVLVVLILVVWLLSMAGFVDTSLFSSRNIR